MRRIPTLARLLSLFAFLMVLLAPAARAEVIQLDNAGLQKLLDEGVTIVDIRRPDEWQHTGIVRGSHLITFFHDKEYKVFDIPAWLEAFGKVAAKGKPVILICRSGNRTTSVSDLVNQQGYPKVYNVTEGITRWIKDGNPVVPWEVQPADAANK